MQKTQAELGKRIARLREARHWKQADLALLVEVSEKTIGNWENGRNLPRNKIGALEEIFGVDLETGLPRDDDDPVHRAIRTSGLSKGGQYDMLGLYERLRIAEGLTDIHPSEGVTDTGT